MTADLRRGLIELMDTTLADGLLLVKYDQERDRLAPVASLRRDESGINDSAPPGLTPEGICRAIDSRATVIGGAQSPGWGRFSVAKSLWRSDESDRPVGLRTIHATIDSEFRSTSTVSAPVFLADQLVGVIHLELHLVLLFPAGLRRRLRGEKTAFTEADAAAASAAAMLLAGAVDQAS